MYYPLQELRPYLSPSSRSLRASYDLPPSDVCATLRRVALAPLPRAEVEPALDKGFAALAWRASPGPVAGVPSGGAAEQSPERPVEVSH